MPQCHSFPNDKLRWQWQWRQWWLHGPCPQARLFFLLNEAASCPKCCLLLAPQHRPPLGRQAMFLLASPYRPPIILPPGSVLPTPATPQAHRRWEIGPRSARGPFQGNGQHCGVGRQQQGMGVGICQAKLGQEQSGTVIDTTGTSEVVHGAQTGRQHRGRQKCLQELAWLQPALTRAGRSYPGTGWRHAHRCSCWQSLPEWHTKQVITA